MIPNNKLIDKLKDEEKKFQKIKDKDFSNVYEAREVANDSFLNQLNGNEKTITKDQDQNLIEKKLELVKVVRGNFDDVIGVQLEWQ